MCVWLSGEARGLQDRQRDPSAAGCDQSAHTVSLAHSPINEWK